MRLRQWAHGRGFMHNQLIKNKKCLGNQNHWFKSCSRSIKLRRIGPNLIPITLVKPQVKELRDLCGRAASPSASVLLPFSPWRHCKVCRPIAVVVVTWRRLVIYPFTIMARTEEFKRLLCLPCHLYGPLEVHHLPF